MTRIISHMPGAAGNFMARLFTQATSPDRFMPELSYDPGPAKTRWDGFEVYGQWREWERRARTPDYRHTHHATPHLSPWLRITVATEREWMWAESNAQYKGSDIRTHQLGDWGEFHLASDPGLPAGHRVRLQHLWRWPDLERVLTQIQPVPVNPHQHRLWREWSQTWCPHTDHPLWRQRLDSRWRDLRPRW